VFGVARCICGDDGGEAVMSSGIPLPKRALIWFIAILATLVFDEGEAVSGLRNSTA
jgi:hypothetical protein